MSDFKSLINSDVNRLQKLADRCHQSAKAEVFLVAPLGATTTPKKGW